MAVNLDAESDYFKFVVISDKPNPSKNKLSEKPSKDKDNMSTNPSPPPNNEKLNEKKQNSPETNKQTVPEVKVNDAPNNNEDSTKEQEKEEKASGLTIKVPSRSTSPQLVTSPNEITGAKTPPVSPSSNIFKNVGKKLGNMMKQSADNGTAANPVPNQEEDSKVQMQQEQIVGNTAANNDITDVAKVESPVEERPKEDEDKKVTPETAASKQRTGSLANMKLLFTRTSSLLVERVKEGFDNLDRRIYPDMDPDWTLENQDKLSKETAVSEREQLLENKDVEITNGTSQKSHPTQNIMADAKEALNERGEKLESIGERAEALNNNVTGFLEMARALSKEQEQKSKSWKFW